MALGALLAILVVAPGLVSLRAGPSGIRAPDCPSPSASPPSAKSPISHVFWILKENHAFENYFGDMPGVTGYPPSGSFPLAYGANATISPFPLTTTSTPDLPHDHASLLRDLDGGRNDLYVAQARAMGAALPQDAVGYYTASQLPDYYTYAREFGLGDAFFSGVLGPTNPNRFFDLSAFVGNWTEESPPPSSLYGTPTILDQFTEAGLPWSYLYSGAGGNRTPDEFLAESPLVSCELTHVAPVSELASQLAGPAPPSLTVVDTSWDPVYGEHPPANVTLGEAWTVAFVNAVFSSPIASSSAVLISFDEGGGFWDPVTPPSFGSVGDGPRVPFLVISPWTPAGTLVHQTLDPASVLSFLDGNWGLPPLSPRVSGASSLSPFFDFQGAPRTVPILPTSVQLPRSAAPLISPRTPADPRVPSFLALPVAGPRDYYPVVSLALAARYAEAPRHRQHGAPRGALAGHREGLRDRHSPRSAPLAHGRS